MKQKTVNFEQAFERLEQILDQMNSSQLSLDQSLTMYEEANGLIQNCQAHLQNAEKRVEVLIKNRNQSLQVNENGELLIEEFQTQNEKAMPKF